MRMRTVVILGLITFQAAPGQSISWQPAGTLTQGDIRSLVGTSWGNVFAGRAAPFGELRMSTDNGQTWARVGGSAISPSDQVNVLVTKEPNRVFAGLSILGVAGSADGGYTWSTMGLVETEVFALGVSSGQFVFAGTWLSGVYRFTANGDTWASVNTGFPMCHPWSCPVKSLAFDSSGTVFAGLAGGGIYHSTNNGDLWLPFPSPTPYSYPLAFHAAGALFAGHVTGIFRSTDQGGTWSHDTIGAVTSISINTVGHIFAGTYGNGVFRSTDIGDTWLPVNSGLTNMRIWCVTVTPQGYVFVGTATSGVFRTVESTNAAPEDVWTIPREYELHQNYPNPFNPTTTIEYALPRRARVKVAVYDILGREVAALVDAEKEAGVHKLQWDGSTLSSGVYLYRLEVPGSVLMRKMVLVR